MSKKFCVVFVPANEQQDVEEWSLEIAKGDEVGCLIDRLKQHYRDYDKQAQTKVDAASREQHKKRILEEAKKYSGGKDVEPPSGFFDQLMDMYQIEPYPLLLNRKSTEFVGVNLYVDDHGMLKSLPHNKRASAICATVGKPCNVLGDAFIGRFFDNEDEFKRYDFTLADISSSDVEWMKKARAENSQTASENAKTLESAQCAHGHTGCGVQPKLRCSRCKNIGYCSQDCQKKDWKRHKPVCLSSSKSRNSGKAKHNIVP